MEYKLLVFVLLISAVRVQGISFGTRYNEHFTYLAGLFEAHEANLPCSGFVLSPKAILTAAHCAEKINVLAILYFSIFGYEQEVLEDEIERTIVLHPNYNKETKENDFAVVTISRNLSIVSMPGLTTTETEENTKCFVSGYGTQVKGKFETQYPIFKEVEVTSCNGESPGRICASGQINSTHKAGVLCDGDAGAPLVCNNELVGIAVSDNSCGTGGPDVYQSVRGFQAWIEEQIASVHQEDTSASTSTIITTTTKIPTSTSKITSTTKITSTGEPGSASTSALNLLISIASLSVLLKTTLMWGSI